MLFRWHEMIVCSIQLLGFVMLILVFSSVLVAVVIIVLITLVIIVLIAVMIIVLGVVNKCVLTINIQKCRFPPKLTLLLTN